MTLSTNDAINRFGENEERVNKFVNEEGSYSTNTSPVKNVKTLPSFMEELRSRYLPYNLKGNWNTGTSYEIQDIVTQSGFAYMCLENHTSGTFATDLLLNKWQIYQGVTPSALAADEGADLIGSKREEADAVPMTQQKRNNIAVMYVEDFGDNTTPGTSDMRAAWNKAIAALPSRGGKVRSRSGSLHYISDFVSLKPRVQIELDGAEIRPASNKDAFVMSGTPVASGRTVITGGKIAAAAYSTGYGVKAVGNYPFFTISDMEFSNFVRGAMLQDCYCSTIEQSDARGCAIGFELRGESHNSSLVDLFADYCTVAATALNYGSNGTEQPIHSVNIIGGAFQNSANGLWLERCYETSLMGSIYHEGNTTSDLRIGVADAGGYAKAAYNTSLKGSWQTSSSCAVNIIVEHAVGVDLDRLSFQGASSGSTHWSIDGYSDKIRMSYHRLANTATPGIYLGSALERTVIEQNGRSLFPAGMTDAIQFGSIAQKLSRIHQNYTGAGRNALIIESLVEDLMLKAAAGTGVIRFGDSGNNEYFRIDFVNNRVEVPSGRQFCFSSSDFMATGLPTSSAGLNSGQLWVDTSAGNVIKRVP